MHYKTTTDNQGFIGSASPRADCSNQKGNAGLKKIF